MKSLNLHFSDDFRLRKSAFFSQANSGSVGFHSPYSLILIFSSSGSWPMSIQSFSLTG